MKNKLVIITGVGYKTTLKKDVPITSNIFSNKNIKVNIGTAIAKELVKDGCDILLVAKSKDKLNAIKQSLNKFSKVSLIQVFPVDLLDFNKTSKIISKIKNYREVNLVHSIGLSAGSYKVKNDNPYLHVEKIPTDLPVKEFEVVVKSLLLLVKVLLPKFKKQEESHIVVISSMSGIRAFPLGFSHSAAKAGLHFATRSLSLELNKYNIFVSEIQPGIVNTGMYDTKLVQSAVKEIGEAFGYNYELGKIPQMPPESIGEAVLLCLKNKSHILTISMVSKGQWPNLGA